ncbi:hypothetical protein [Pantanalinema sp. GBBB05]|uniref:hypothetical protein n=1 Tax=Pantanalinema sp. GBBB05 TaxID=2604139 RepID=UPI001DAF3368|nr:hypothetical protein [Pantanalinema sp. GBBB05]
MVTVIIGHILALRIQEFFPNPSALNWYFWQDWLDAHPTIAWLVQNPLWAIVCLLLAIFLLWKLLAAVAQLAEKILLAILLFPLKLGQWLLAKMTHFFKTTVVARFLPSKSPEPEPPPTANLTVAMLKPTDPVPALKPAIAQDSNQRLTDIVSRLEALRREQDELLQEVKTILLSDRG